MKVQVWAVGQVYLLSGRLRLAAGAESVLGEKIALRCREENSPIFETTEYRSSEGRALLHWMSSRKHIILGLKVLSQGCLGGSGQFSVRPQLRS